MHEKIPEDPEPAQLLELAQWYRSWAELASSEREKAERLSFAEALERRAREKSGS